MSKKQPSLMEKKVKFALTTKQPIYITESMRQKIVETYGINLEEVATRYPIPQGQKAYRALPSF